MIVIHANDPTTRVLSLLYEEREDVTTHVTEEFTNGEVTRALQAGSADNTVMMLGHGNEYGLFSKPDRRGRQERFLISDRHVQFLRDKNCIGIWCKAEEFARRYKLHGLFSGMIISELQEAEECKIAATKEEIDVEIEKFTRRLKDCIERYGRKETPMRMRELDDVKSELTDFNYRRLYYF